MIRYRTVAKDAEARLVVERSEFIAHIAGAASREEAEGFIKSVRARYKDASHNVPAFVIGEKSELQWASDDGEPQGTAGAPVVQLLTASGLTNVVCVVTRYFGGIKLGTGGLVRAYTQVARMAIEEAGVREARDVTTVSVKLAYPLLGRLKNSAAALGYEIEDIAYTEHVTVKLSFEPEREESIMAALDDMTGGKTEIVEREEKIS